jgi:hypothetical protein
MRGKCEPTIWGKIRVILTARFIIQKERSMLTFRKNVVSLFVHRPSQQWIALDPDGNYWKMPSDSENPWNERQPFHPTDETELEPVPGHYKSMLGLPT